MHSAHYQMNDFFRRELFVDFCDVIYCRFFSFSFFCELQSLGEKPILITLLASMISGVFLSIGMTPFDVVATRLFNQGLQLFLFPLAKRNENSFQSLCLCVDSHLKKFFNFSFDLKESTRMERDCFTTTSSIASLKHSKSKECAACTRDSPPTI